MPSPLIMTIFFGAVSRMSPPGSASIQNISSERWRRRNRPSRTWVSNCPMRTIPQKSRPMGEFTKNLNILTTSPDLWAARQRTVSLEAIGLRQCTLGELCWLATELRPDICDRLARIAPRANSLQGGDVYRVSDPVKTVQVWRQATILKYASASHSGPPARGDTDGRMRSRGN